MTVVRSGRWGRHTVTHRKGERFGVERGPTTHLFCWVTCVLFRVTNVGPPRAPHTQRTRVTDTESVFVGWSLVWSLRRPSVRSLGPGVHENAWVIRN